MTARFIGQTYNEYQRELVEHVPYGKQIGKLLDIKKKQKRHRAPKHILLGLKSEKSGNQVPIFENYEKYIKDAPKQTMQNGSDTFANELMRFRNEAKPIWVEIQKHCTKCSHNLNGALTF